VTSPVPSRSPCPSPTAGHILESGHVLLDGAAAALLASEEVRRVALAL